MMDNSNVFRLMLDKAIADEPIGFEGFDRTKNVQDQLQEMLGLSDRQLMKQFRDFLIWITGEKPYDRYNTGDNPPAAMPYGIFLSSMEQLWLAFGQKELHNKIWNGEDWIKGGR